MDGSDWSDLAINTGATATTHSHTGLKGEATRHYRVLAINSAGAGPASNAATGTTVLSTAFDDRAILVALYDATNGANWTENKNWQSDLPMSKWYGVTTDRRGRVTGLSLQENRLLGEIPPELGSFSNLEFLRLSQNQLRGEIPPKLGGLSRLRGLFLSENQLSGEVPPELGNLSNLAALYLWGNQLTGEIPRELGNLFDLDFLSLNDNQLTGKIQQELGNLSNLESLYLSHNRLSGDIPKELGDLFNLDGLGLGENRNLTGCVPASLWDVPNNDLPTVGLPSCDGKEYAKSYFSIQGTVTGPNGEPLEGVLIRAQDVRTDRYGGVSISNYDITARDGSFLIRVPDESYFLLVGNDDCNYVGAYESGGFTQYTNEGTPVQVDGSDVTGIEIILPDDPNELRVTRTSSCY